MRDFNLNFLGNGSCFNTEFGNTSAYFKYKRIEDGRSILEEDEEIYNAITYGFKTKLVLIDCGETTFERLMNKKILDDVDEVDILITHLHSDHVGSLPSLIFYLHFVKGIKPEIVFEGNITKYLDICNVDRSFYKKQDITVMRYLPVKVKHAKVKHAYGYIINIISKCTAIYYSGDSCTIPNEILEKFKKEEFSTFPFKISRIYQDVTRFENDVHMNIHSLAGLFSEEERKRVTCMHFDDMETLEIARRYGFDIAEVK